MTTIQCLIVDDEPLAREIIQTYTSKIPGWELVGSCINAEEAYEALMKSEVDVLFLDIQMPVITGMDFLRSLRKPPMVVFTTAYNHYAAEGFDLNAVDYLLKPITVDRFFQAVEKVKEKITLANKQIAGKGKDQVPYIFIRDCGRLIKINFDEVLYIKAEKDFSSIYIKEKRLLASMHLKLLEESLPEKLFTRVHRSYIIQHAMITSIYGNTIYIDKTEIPIGANYKDELYRKLNIS